MSGGAGSPGTGQGGQGTGTGHTDGPAGQEPGTATVFDPVLSGDGETGTVGGGTGGDSETVGTGAGATESGSRNVALSDALPQYTAEATQALDATAVPPSVRSLVLAYFDSLAARVAAPR